jgi:hypothetical protein
MRLDAPRAPFRLRPHHAQARQLVVAPPQSSSTASSSTARRSASSRGSSSTSRSAPRASSRPGRAAGGHVRRAPKTRYLDVQLDKLQATLRVPQACRGSGDR